jgi:hypothetical protein
MDRRQLPALGKLAYFLVDGKLQNEGKLGFFLNRVFAPILWAKVK